VLCKTVAPGWITKNLYAMANMGFKRRESGGGAARSAFFTMSLARGFCELELVAANVAWIERHHSNANLRMADRSLSRTIHRRLTGSSMPTLRAFVGIAIFVVSFALAAYVVADKRGVDYLLGSVGPFRVPLAVLIFAIVAAARFSVTDALAVTNGVLFGP
jgi:hypothetical protein